MTSPVAGLDALTTAEQQLQKLAIAIQSAELGIPAETRPNNVTITADFETQVLAYTFTGLPFTAASGAGGVLALTVGTYPGLP